MNTENNASAPSPSPLRWGCQMVPIGDNELVIVVSPCGKYALSRGIEIPGEWHKIPVGSKPRDIDGWYAPDSVDEALANTPEPPPGYAPAEGETRAALVDAVVRAASDWRDNHFALEPLPSRHEEPLYRAIEALRAHDAAQADPAKVVDEPAPETRTVTDPTEIRAVLDRLPVGAKATIVWWGESHEVTKEADNRFSDNNRRHIFTSKFNWTSYPGNSVTYTLSDDPAHAPAGEAKRSGANLEPASIGFTDAAKPSAPCAKCGGRQKVLNGHEMDDCPVCVQPFQVDRRDPSLAERVAKVEGEVAALKTDTYKWAAEVQVARALIKNIESVVFPKDESDRSQMNNNDATATPNEQDGPKVCNPRYEACYGGGRAWHVREVATGLRYITSTNGWTTGDDYTRFYFLDIALAVCDALNAWEVK